MDLSAPVQKILETGVLGALVVILAWGLVNERKTNKELNDKRVAEAQAFYEKFIVLTNKVTEVVEKFTAALNGRVK